jgi:hypothetical protein
MRQPPDRYGGDRDRAARLAGASPSLPTVLRPGIADRLPLRNGVRTAKRAARCDPCDSRGKHRSRAPWTGKDAPVGIPASPAQRINALSLLLPATVPSGRAVTSTETSGLIHSGNVTRLSLWLMISGSIWNFIFMLKCVKSISGKSSAGSSTGPLGSGVHRLLLLETRTHMLGVPPKSSGGATNPCVMSRLTKCATPGLFQTGIE